MSAIDQGLYARAKYFVLFDRKASTSYVQRKLQIGYNTAAALIEQMEHDGIVGPANHVGKREILLGPPDPKEELPPWEPEATPQDTTSFTEAPAETDSAQSTPEAVPPAPKAQPTGPMVNHSCSSCNAKARGPQDGLPEGWYDRASKFGRLMTCDKCSEKHAVRIATTHMTTEEIMSADGNDVITGAAQGRLRTIFERIGRVREDMMACAEDLKEIYSEAKGEGFDVKILRKLVSEMQKDATKRSEERALLELYAEAIGETL